MALNAVEFNVFTEDEKSAIMFLGKEKSLDSTFVLKCVRFLYKNDLNVLRARTVVKSRDGKQPMTPKKRNIISSAFGCRMEKYKDQMSDVELNLRWNDKAIVDHIQNGIQNTVKYLNKASEVEAPVAIDDNRTEIETFYVDADGNIYECDPLIQSDNPNDLISEE